MTRFRYFAVFGAAFRKEDSFDQTEFVRLARRLTPQMAAHRSPDGRRGWILEVTPRYESPTLLQLRSRQGLEIGIASTRTASLAAAVVAVNRHSTHQNATICSIPPGKEREFLSPLPVETLSFLSLNSIDDMIKTLGQWGVRNLGEFAALPPVELCARMGSSALDLQRMALGEDLEPFQAELPLVNFEESRDLEWGLESLEPLAFILGGMSDSICRKLEKRALAAEALTLKLTLERGPSLLRTLHLAFPMRSSKTFLSLLRLDLQSDPPREPILGVKLTAQAVIPRTFQYSLLQATRPDPEKVSRTLARLGALVGKDNVGSPERLDTHRPDSFGLRPFRLEDGMGKKKKRRPFKTPPRWKQDLCLTLRRFRPPQPIRIKRQQVVRWSGPWHASGDWWEDKLQWDRKEWEIEFKGGVICRVFRDQISQRWFLEGIYD